MKFSERSEGVKALMKVDTYLSQQSVFCTSQVVTVSSMAECKEQCEGTHGCTGIELSGSRCEIWTRNIEASRGVSGLTCHL